MEIEANHTLLQQLTERLIGPSGTAGQWLQASHDLYRLLLDVSCLDTEAGANQQDMALDSGKALAPVWAAHCILDFMRTRVFLRGVLQAIDSIGKRFPDTELHVLYAGTGPFATLVLPLIPLLDPAKVRFTLLEISSESIDCLEKVVKAFGFEPWIREIICADATTYRTAAPLHIVITEMMQAGLRREPQVAATLNLAPQIVPGGCLIPQQIRLQAGLLHPERDQERMTQEEASSGEIFQLMGTVFELSQNTALPPSGIFPEIMLNFPANRDPAFSRLALFTEIQIFETTHLDTWQSGLTQPLILTSLPPEKAATQVGFQYKPGKEPGFEWRFT